MSKTLIMSDGGNRPYEVQQPKVTYITFYGAKSYRYYFWKIRGGNG